MNFTREESALLYQNAKRRGASPFACMTYAGAMACSVAMIFETSENCPAVGLPADNT
jgi:hypothetical protein